MNKTRLEAFSDGVLAIVITIMVLELKMPHGTSWEAIKVVFPSLGSYFMSFLFIGIYWGNHHHLLHLMQKVNGKIIWANLHLLFWLSLVPFATTWMAENNFENVTVAVYGALLVFCGVAFIFLAKVGVNLSSVNDDLRQVFRRSERKGTISSMLYIASIPLAFVEPLISCSIFIFVAMMWIIPNREVEKLLGE